MDSFPNGPDRELAARRRELELEFEAKQRDLKAQHKRHLDRIEAEKQDFEQYRREKVKELADREQKLKGREGRALAVVQKGPEDRQEIEALTQQLADVRERRDLLARKVADLEGKAGRADSKAKANWWRLVAMVAVAILAALVWLVLALKQGGGSRLVPPLVVLALVVAVTAWPTKSPRSK